MVSAHSSRCRDRASHVSVPTAYRTAAATPAGSRTIPQTTAAARPAPCRSRPVIRPVHQPRSSPAHRLGNDATAPTRTSRFATCAVSWARTAATSAGSSRERSPAVTHTTAEPGPEPAAKAFGASRPETASRGFGSPDDMHSRSRTACSSGSSAAVTCRASSARSASRSPARAEKSAKAMAAATAAAPQTGPARNAGSAAAA
ncbi:hypothetical protein LUX39_46575 [Actinomadura madurae]|nr:hypothetical protein [Actinomadura madurae]MCQ0020262.1 hypothetical protein [Actinomadura madurae]